MQADSGDSQVKLSNKVYFEKQSKKLMGQQNLRLV